MLIKNILNTFIGFNMNVNSNKSELLVLLNYYYLKNNIEIQIVIC